MLSQYYALCQRKTKIKTKLQKETILIILVIVVCVYWLQTRKFFFQEQFELTAGICYQKGMIQITGRNGSQIILPGPDAAKHNTMADMGVVIIRFSIYISHHHLSSGWCQQTPKRAKSSICRQKLLLFHESPQHFVNIYFCVRIRPGFFLCFLWVRSIFCEIYFFLLPFSFLQYTRTIFGGHQLHDIDMFE